MAPYFSVFLLISAFSLASHAREVQRYRLVLLLLISMVLILFSGLRGIGVGADDKGYVEWFLNIHKYFSVYEGRILYSFSEMNMEFGYVLLTSILRHLTDSYTALFLLLALISVSINAYNYQKYSEHVFLVLLLYFAHHFIHKDMNAVRSGVASAILLFSIAYADRREYLKVFSIVMLASLFHITALAALLPALMCKFLAHRNRATLLLLTSVFISFSSPAQIIINHLPNMGPVTAKLSYYMESSQYNYDLGVLSIVNIKNLILLSILLFFWKNLKRNLVYFDALMSFFLVSVIWRLIFSDFALVAGRVSAILGITEVILIPSLLYCVKEKVLVSILIMLYALLILILNMYNPLLGDITYSTSLF